METMVPRQILKKFPKRVIVIPYVFSEETPISCPPFESFISFDERFTTVRDDLKPFIESLGTHIWNKFIRDVERLYRSNRSLDSLGVSESISCNNLLAKIFPMSTISKYQQNAYLLFEKW